MHGAPGSSALCAITSSSHTASGAPGLQAGVLGARELPGVGQHEGMVVVLSPRPVVPLLPLSASLFRHTLVQWVSNFDPGQNHPEHWSVQIAGPPFTVSGSWIRGSTPDSALIPVPRAAAAAAGTKTPLSEPPCPLVLSPGRAL